MRPTFMGFETTKRGMMVNQKALDIVSNNIANLGVTGYTRQRVDQVSITSAGVSGRYGQTAAQLAGQGSNIKGIAQLRDPYLDKRFRQENSDVGFYNKMTEIMTDVETALDETVSPGLKSSIEKLSKALTALSGGINSTNANVVRTSAKSMTQILQQFDTKLSNIIDQQKADLEINVNHVNSILQSLSNINASIAKDSFEHNSGGDGTYYGPNELLDTRNVLLDELSTYGDILVTTNPDNSVTVKMGGHQVVKGDTHETVTYVENTDNTVSVLWQSNGEKAKFSTGAILASTDMINGRGPKAVGNQNAERGVPYYKDQLDSFAKTFATSFNNAIPELDADGNPAIDPVTGLNVYKTLFVFDGLKTPGAGSIGISDTWNTDSDFILTPGSVKGEYDNTYFNKLIATFQEPLRFDNGYTGTYEGFVKNYTTTLGEDKTFSTDRLMASSGIAESVMDSISQISGVSMDEEGADMMAYSKAYSAMSRVMTALDEALDTLINKTGLVGR